MKKLLFLMMALMVAPAMADVVFSVVDLANKKANIMVEFTGTDTVDGLNTKSLIAGIALDVSVDVGTIVAVTNYKADNFPITPAMSTAASPGYGIHMTTITFTGDPCEIATAGTPQAPFDAPTGDPIVLPAVAIVLEHGALYNVGNPNDAPLAGLQTLCTIEVSEEATLTIDGGNATRSGVVRKGGGVPTTIDYGSGTLVTGFAVACPFDVTDTVTGTYQSPPPPPFTMLFDVTRWTGPSGSVNLNDLNAVVALLVDEFNTSATYVISPVPTEAADADVTDTVTGTYQSPPPPPFTMLFDRTRWTGPSGEVNLNDLNALVALLVDEFNTNADYDWACP